MVSCVFVVDKGCHLARINYEIKIVYFRLRFGLVTK